MSMEKSNSIQMQSESETEQKHIGSVCYEALSFFFFANWKVKETNKIKWLGLYEDHGYLIGAQTWFAQNLWF